MKLFQRIKKNNGEREIFLCGTKIFNYISKSFIKNCLTIFKLDILKYKNFVININNTKNLVLGSSHARNGFYPQAEDYNMGGSSQDLYTSYNLYKYVLSKNATNLKNVILFYSPFSPGFQLCKTSEAWKCVPYKVFYNINYQDIPSKTISSIEKIFEPRLKKYSVEISKDYRGEYLFYDDIGEQEVLAPVAKHWLKHNRRNSSQNEFIKLFAEEIKANNQELYVIISPIRADLRLLLPNKSVLYKDLYNILEKYPFVHLLDYYDSEDFDVLDYEDCSHLNKNGAVKCTEYIKSVIYNRENGSNSVIVE